MAKNKSILRKLVLLSILVILLSPALYVYWKYSSSYEIRDGIAYEKVVPLNKKPLRSATSRFSRKSDYVSDGSQKMRELQYYWYSPSKTEDDSNQSLPLVVMLHGGTGYAYAGEYLTEHDIVSRFPTYILVPMAPAYTVWGGKYLLGWNEPELPYVVKLIDRLKVKYNIDPKRIYVLGCSMGGHGVFYAAQAYSNVFAAGVSISGIWDINAASQMAKMPLYIMAGKKDRIVSRDKTKALAEEISSYGGEVRYTEFNMGHNCPSQHYYTRDVWHWMFSKTLH